jgi:hypothetical protein
MRRNNFSQVAFGEVWKGRAATLVTNMFFLEDLEANPHLAGGRLEEAKALMHGGLLLHFALRALFAMPPRIADMVGRLRREAQLGAPADHEPFLVSLQVRQGDGAQLRHPPKEASGEARKRRFVPNTHLGCFVEEAIWHWEFLDEQEKAGRFPVFHVTADTSGTINTLMGSLEAKGFKAFETSSVAGPLVHLDRGSRAQARTFLDWWLMALADRLVISQSGFSYTASKLSCSPLSLFAPPPGISASAPCPSHFARHLAGLCVHGVNVTTVANQAHRSHLLY